MMALDPDYSVHMDIDILYSNMRKMYKEKKQQLKSL